MTTTENPFAAGRTKTPPKKTSPAADSLAAAPGDKAEPKKGLGAPAALGDPFGIPAGPGSGEKVSDYVGNLLIITPTEYIESMQTTASKDPVDVVRADVVVLDHEDGPYEIEGMLIFQMALKRELKSFMRKGESSRMLARLQMGTKKPGQNAPYIFEAPSEEDFDAARAYDAARRK